MILEEAVYYRMANYADLEDLVGTRIYPGSIPQDAALPAIAYQTIDHETWMAHDGPSGLARSVVQITIAADDYSDVKDVGEAVKTCWSGFRGSIGTTVDSLHIGLAKIVTIQDIDNRQVERALGLTFDVEIFHAEH